MLFKLAGRHRIKRLGPFTFKIDRPKGYVKTWGSKSFTYPCDYGYFPGVKGEDGEALDAFVGDDLSGRMESFLKLKKDPSGNLVPDETKFLVGVSEKDAKKIYALYGDEASQRVTYESVDDLKAAVKEFKPMKKERYESVEEKTAGPVSPREEETPTKLAATQALERFGIKAASAKTADLYKKLLGEIMARKRGKPTEKTAANKMFRVLRDMPDGPEREEMISRLSRLIPLTRPVPGRPREKWRVAVEDKALLARLKNTTDVLRAEAAQWEALPRAPNVSAPAPAQTQPLEAQLLPSVPQSVSEVNARLQAVAEELADYAASKDKSHAAAKDLHGVATAMSAGAEALAAHNARLLGNFDPPPALKPEVASNPAGPQSMYARFRKLPRLAQGAIVTPAALLSAYGLYRGGKALVNHFSPEEKEEQPTKLGAAELAYKLAPSLANAYDAYQATSAALDAQKEQEERMRFPALHATQPERMMNSMYAMDPSSTGSFDSPPVHHRRHRRHHH